MTWRKQLREMQEERQKLIHQDLWLRTEFKRQFDETLLYVRLADQVVTLVSRLVGGRRSRRASRP